MATTETIAITTDVGQVAQALAAFFKAADDIFLVANSPAMLAVRRNAAVQAELVRMDADLVQAQKTGDLKKIDQEASG